MNQRTEKEQIIADLKWVVVHLGEPEKNTFGYAQKTYIEAAISYIERVVESNHEKLLQSK